MSEQTWTPSPDETTLGAQPDETEVLSESVTDFVPLAWSREFQGAEVVPYSAPRSSRGYWLANVAVLIAAVVITWLCVDHFVKRPVVVAPPPSAAPPVVAPPPASAPPALPPGATVTTLPPEPPVAAPTQPPVEVPPVATVNAETIAHFRELLAADGMHLNQVGQSMKTFAEGLCEDAAYGHLHDPAYYMSPTPGDGEPPNASQHAVHDALQAFCPRYAGLI